MKKSNINNELKINPPIWFYYLIFAISGFSGLIYESIWSHYLKLFLGHAALAQSLVLIIFMGGMALGAWWASRFSERLKSPILIYVIVELIIGCIALVFHNTFTSLISIFYETLLPSINTPALGSTLKWLVASLLILPQSILLGMTFPLMTAGILRRYPNSPGTSISTLYFTNSIGAAIGVLTSGFILIEKFGLPGTIFTAGILNVFLAVLTWMILRLDIHTPSIPKPHNSQIDTNYKLQTTFLFIACITGIASFIYEISWIRMLSLVLGSTTHSFELMLSAFITGLAFGGFWIRKKIDTIKSPIKYLATIQIFMGIFAILTIPVYVQSFDWMSDIITTINHQSDKGYFYFTILSHIIVLAVMLPTTICAGMTLPLITYVLLDNKVGEKCIGRVYSINTFGAIFGVLFAIHIGLPFLGVKLLVISGAILDISLGIFLYTLINKSSIKKRNLVFATISIFIALSIGLQSDLNKNLLSSGVYRHGNLETSSNFDVTYYRDGKTASIAFINNPSGSSSLITNGKPDAALNINLDDKDRSGDEITMTLLGSLALAYSPNAKTVANIGMGSGMTTHTILYDRNIELVDTIEIETSIIEASKNFGALVSNTFKDSRSKIHIDDAKTFFSVRNKKYDIIIAEPSNPWVSGVSSLFSKEFYNTIKRHINDEGLFIQWIQLYEFDDSLLLSILSALSENFDDYAIYFANNSDILIVSKAHGLLDKPNWDKLINGDLKDALNRQSINTSEDLEIRKISDKKTLSYFFDSYKAQPNSDYYPFVDLNAGKARFKKSRSELLLNISDFGLPILEVLDDKTINFKKVSSAENYFFSNNVASASLIANAFIPEVKVKNDNLLNSKAQAIITNLKLISKNCAFIEFEVIYENAVTMIAKQTLSYIDKDDSNKLFAALRGKCNESSLPKYQHARLSFFESVGQRDLINIINTGELLLTKYKNRINDEDYNFIASGILLGYIKLEQIEQAANFYSHFIINENKSYGSLDHEKLLLNILRSKASNP